MTFIRPCIKPYFHAATHLSTDESAASGVLSVAFHYGRERGLVLEGLDEGQLLLLSLLDGEHSLEDIVTRLQAHDANITKDEVAEQLEDYAAVGLIEDAGVSPPSCLTPTDLERYAGQIRFFSILDTTGKQRFDLQGRLKNARVLVLGLGGLGSNVLTGLAASGVGFLRGVDGDTVEISNLNRQVLYDVAEVGQPKVVAAAAHLKRFNPEITFEAHCEYVRSKERVADLMRDVDVVAMCADTPGLFPWANDLALVLGTPFIMGGYRGISAEVGPFVVPNKTACLACWGVQQAPEPPEALHWVNNGYWLRHPTSFMTTSAAASLMCGEIIKQLTGFATPVTYNTIYALDFESFTLTASPVVRDPHCPRCGDGAPTEENNSIGAAAERAESTV